MVAMKWVVREGGGCILFIKLHSHFIDNFMAFAIFLSTFLSLTLSFSSPHLPSLTLSLSISVRKKIFSSLFRLFPVAPFKYLFN